VLPAAPSERHRFWASEIPARLQCSAGSEVYGIGAVGVVLHHVPNVPDRGWHRLALDRGPRGASLTVE
jgi:hypothetical protein